MNYLRLLLALFLLFPASVFSEAELAHDANSHYEKALSSFAQEDLESSYIHLKNTLKIDANYLPAKLLLGKVYFNAGNISAAEKEFEECLELGLDINLVLPLYGSTLILQKKTDKLLGLDYYSNEFTRATQYEWRLLKGQVHLSESRLDQAIVEFEKASTILPADPRALNSQAAIFLEQGLQSRASKLVEKSLAISRENEKTWQLKGEIAYRDGRLDEALDYFYKGYQLDQEDALILHGLAKIHMQQKQFSKAKPYLDSILDISPGDPVATIQLAIAMLNLNDQEHGKELLGDLSDKLSNLDKSELKKYGFNADFIRATSEFIQGNHEKARALLETYVHANPGNLFAIRMLTDVLLREDHPATAIQLLEAQHDHIRDDYGLTLQLAYFYAEAGKFYRAERQLNTLKRLDPLNPYTVLMKAEILTARKKYEDALKSLDSRNFRGSEPLDITLKRGDLQLKTNRLDEAVATSRGLLDAHPDHPAVLNFAAITALNVNDLEKAQQYLDQVLSRFPGNSVAVYHYALLQKMLGNFEQAIASAKVFLKTSPEHVPSILIIARTKLAQQQYDASLEWAKKAIYFDGEDIRARELILEIYTRKGDWESALSTINELRKIKPLETKYLYRKAEILIEMERYKEAQKPLYLLSGYWEKEPDNLLKLSRLQVASNNYPAARESLDTAIKQKPGSIPLQLELAKLFVSEGNFAEASSITKQLRRKATALGELEMFEGDIARFQGDLPSARHHYTKAFADSTTRQAASIHLYQLTLLGEGGKEFIRLMEKSIKSNTAPQWMRKLLADSYLNQGDVEKARSHYETLLSNPKLSENPEILNNLANIYAERDLEKAIRTAKLGLKLGSRYPALLDTMGWLLIQQNKNSEALTYLRDAYSLDSRIPEIRYHQGVALMNLGRNSEALRELKAAIKMSTQFRGFKDAVDRVDRLQMESSAIPSKKMVAQ